MQDVGIRTCEEGPMKYRRAAGGAVVAATLAALAGLAGLGVRVTVGDTAGGSGAVAMREIVHVQATPAPAGYVPANDGTIIVEN